MRYLLDRVSYHAVYDSSILEALGYAKAHGFSGVQLALDVPSLSFEGAGGEVTQAVRRKCEQEHLRVVLHVPDDLSLVETSRLRIRGTWDYCEAMFDWARRIGCKLIVFHVGKPATFKMDGGPKDIGPKELLAAAHGAFAENVKRLVDLGAGRLMLCIETWAMTEGVMEVLQPHLDRDEVGITWDLPKTLDEEGRLLPEYQKFLKRNAARIRQLHLHDRREGRSHRVIGTGDIDFLGLLEHIKPQQVADCCIEVRPREKAAESLTHLRAILARTRSSS